MRIPIIDIFAGPGGLGEGFSAYVDPETYQRVFSISLSIEKEYYAHQTLTLRSFFRQFEKDSIPYDYYEFIKGNISLGRLYQKWPTQAEKAENEAWLATLGDNNGAVHANVVDDKIKKALGCKEDWLLIGGPPCQAYSVVGRSRRQEKLLDEKKDVRVGLYKQYLRILAVHNPAVFVMENVKGLLSAKTQENEIFSKIMSDLAEPAAAYNSELSNSGKKMECLGYRIFSLVANPLSYDICDNPIFPQSDFIVHSEKYGVPQTRHRVILLGIRKDIDFRPGVLEPRAEVPISVVLSGLPKLRSVLSKTIDTGDAWKASLNKIVKGDILSGLDIDVKREINRQLEKLNLTKNITGGEFIPFSENSIGYLSEWYLDKKLRGICNHSSRGHMESDLHRYFFLACFALIKNRSPKLEDFPPALLPAHKNVIAGLENKKFADRFRVQLKDRPCKTITSHISKDGHYYIHPDPSQCRSFTVREAARVQTFPDNYYFCGPRTAQFIQVGNAVPPLLANQIAGIVASVFFAKKNIHKRVE
ncbi:MAG: DNA cytosine methyltransferase [Deferribacteres bacterium]|nr:DNA cytosine methyltransferase [Deferribacteres bacterium]